MNILIVEDDAAAVVLIESYLLKAGHQGADVATTLNGAKSALKKNKYNLVFLDIHLGEEESLQCIDLIPASTNIIFTTSDPAYALNAFEVGAVDYLLKPFDQQRFDQAMSKIKISEGDESIVIKANLQYYKIPVSSILYANSNRDYITVHTDDGRQYTFFSKLSTFHEKLPEDGFIHCHRSYLVNADKVTSYNKSVLYIDEIEIPVSRANKKEVEARFRP